MTRAGDDRRYIRSVEAAWSSLRGRATLFSPREYEVIEGWRRRGIPLSTVLEVIADTGKKRLARLPRSVTALSRAVETTWEAVAGGRALRASAPSRPQLDAALAAWVSARDRQPDGSSLRVLLDRLLDHAGSGTEARSLDALLDQELAAAADGALRATIERDVRRELSAFRDRVAEDTYGDMVERALVDRLRTALTLPRLTLA